MGSVFHELCPRYSGTLTPIVPTAIRLWDTFTFTLTSFSLLTCLVVGANHIFSSIKHGTFAILVLPLPLIQVVVSYWRIFVQLVQVKC